MTESNKMNDDISGVDIILEYLNKLKESSNETPTK